MIIEFFNNYKDCKIEVGQKQYILHDIEFPVMEDINDEDLNPNELNMTITYDYKEEI